jgi:predicted ATPase
VIRTPDQRLRVFVSSTLRELAAERRAVRDAVTRLRLVPVMFELGARPHPPRQVYRDYLAQSQVFVGVYWQSYGFIVPGEDISGLEDEYLLSAGIPRLIYVKSPAPHRDPRLARLLAGIKDDDSVSYQYFSAVDELQRLVENDLAVLLSERFEMAGPPPGRARSAAGGEEVPLAGALPAPVTPLVGRDHELAAIENLVLGKGVRLATLTGPGGVGKTRLAVEAAGRLGADFADGVRFADLSCVRAPEQVIDAVAAAVGVSATGARLITDVKRYLRSRRLLLVLDNFEHLMAAAPLVAGLLSTAPGLTVLVTSRKTLRIRGEHELPVPALPVPDAGADSDARAILRYASVRLFAERAQAAYPEFDMTGENARMVAEICRRLEGLPLAIELAAARVRLLPLNTLLAYLDERLGVLTDGPRDLPERQRTLKNTLDWSFDLLSADEQELLRRLGVFSGTFGLPAVEAICASSAAAGPGGPARVTGTLGSLVDSSLVSTRAGGAEPRFGLLDTIREYALGRLHESGYWLEAHDRHATYFAALADPAAADLQGRGQLKWLQRLETDYENLRAAASWLVSRDQLHEAVGLTWETWRFWWFQGHTEELARLAEQILGKSEGLPPRDRALAVSGAGIGRLSIGKQPSGQALLEQSVPLFHQVGDGVHEVLISAVVGHLLAAGHEYARASEYLEKSQAVLREMDDKTFTGSERVQHLANTAVTYNFLGQLRLSLGDLDTAARLFAEGCAAAQRLPDRFTTLISLYGLALGSQAQRDLSGAARYLLEGLSVAADADDRASAAYYIEALATVARLQDKPLRAVRLLAAARSLLARGSGWLHVWVPRASHGDDVLAELRSRLGDAAFDEAWDSGPSTGARQAMEIAMAA